MPGYINYFYNGGVLPAHTTGSFSQYEILTIHVIIVRSALISMHNIKYFPELLP